MAFVELKPYERSEKSFIKTGRLHNWLGKVKAFASYFQNSLDSKSSSRVPLSLRHFRSLLGAWLLCESSAGHLPNYFVVIAAVW